MFDQGGIIAVIWLSITDRGNDNWLIKYEPATADADSKGVWYMYFSRSMIIKMFQTGLDNTIQASVTKQLGIVYCVTMHVSSLGGNGQLPARIHTSDLQHTMLILTN